MHPKLRTHRPGILTLCVSIVALASATMAQEGNQLRLRSGTFDPAIEAPDLAPGLEWGAEEAAATRYRVVQFDHRIRPRDRRALTSVGADVLEYLPHNAQLVRIEAHLLDGLGTIPGVRAVVPLQPADRLSPDLWRPGLDELIPAEGGSYDVELFEGSDAVGAVAAIVALGAELLEWDGPVELRLSVALDPQLLRELVHVDDVQWVQPAPRATLRNDTTTWVVQSNQNNFTPLWNAGLHGENEIIGHIDDALDIDNCYFEDPNNSIGPSHRKIVSHHGNTGSGGSHGTHTGGTAAGDQEPITGSRSNNGIADHARIAHTNLSLISGSNLLEKLEELHADGARVFTNSWGDDGTTAYNAWPRDIDKFAWQNQDALPCWAVTNLGTLKNPENAKNCLAVGATDQANSQHRHCTGGRGPTSDGRRKPEIYAPGCGIRSAEARTSCDTISFDGTSMASPAIAATGALVRQYYLEGFHPTGLANSADAFDPSAALVKATLLNAAVDMTGVSGYPSDTEGWGRVLLDRGLFLDGDSRTHLAVDVARKDGFTGPAQMHSYRFDVLSSSEPLEVTLVFTDKHASLNASHTPVNDLDLELVDPAGLVYRGNVFSNGESTTGGAADELNNVERVRFESPDPGTWTLRVVANNVVTSKSQSYAWVADGDVQGAPLGTWEKYGNGLAGSGGFVPDLSGEGVPNIGSDVRVQVADGLGGAFTKLLIGTARLSVPFAGGELLVAPPWIFVDFVLDGQVDVAGDGSKLLEGEIPDDPALTGTPIDLQALIFDAGAVQGISLTQGLEMVIGQ